MTQRYGRLLNPTSAAWSSPTPFAQYSLSCSLRCLPLTSLQDDMLLSHDAVWKLSYQWSGKKRSSPSLRRLSWTDSRTSRTHQGQTSRAKIMRFATTGTRTRNTLPGSNPALRIANDIQFCSGYREDHNRRAAASRRGFRRLTGVPSGNCAPHELAQSLPRSSRQGSGRPCVAGGA